MKRISIGFIITITFMLLFSVNVFADKTDLFADLESGIELEEGETIEYEVYTYGEDRLQKLTVHDGTIVKKYLNAFISNATLNGFRYRNVVEFKGLKAGTTTAMLVDGNGNKHYFEIVIKPTSEPLSINVTDELPLTVEDEYSIKATGKARIDHVDSSDSEVLEVGKINSDQKSFSIKAVSAGDAEITVVGTNETTCSFTVHVEPKDIVSLDCGDYLLLDAPIEFTQHTQSKVRVRSVQSKDTSIVKCECGWNNEVIFTAYKEGTTTVEITGENGTKNTITVVVKFSGCDYGFNFDHSTYVTLGISDFEDIQADMFCGIYSVKSDNPEIAKVYQFPHSIEIVGEKPGKTKVYVDGYDGDYNPAYAIFEVTVKVKKANLWKLTEFSPDEFDFPYGRKVIDCYAPKVLKGMKVIYKIKCKSKTVSRVGTINSEGKCQVKLPVGKIGKQSTITLSYNNMSVTHKMRIVSNTNVVEYSFGTTQNSRIVKYTAKHVHKGDVATLKIGKKVYKKKIKKDAKRMVLRFKIKPPKKYGIKKTIVIRNKYRQKLCSDSDYVYYGGRLKKGQTKRMVKWSLYWGEPDVIRHYKDGIEQWCYHTDWTYVYFRKGRVVGWQS